MEDLSFNIMKILIISGFLGAGKTSFIKAMSKAVGRQFVIVENEFSELDIDAQFLKNNNEMENSSDMKVWELSEGCICCSLKLDFSNSVLTIANTLDPDFLIVEPSGIAQLSNILSQLKKICYERIELLPPITIIDAENYIKSKEEFSDYFSDQINAASTIVVSKSENLSSEAFIEIKKALNIKENIKFFNCHYSKWKLDDWKLLLNNQKEIEAQSIEIKISDEQRLENISFKKICLKNVGELCTVLDILTTGICGKIVRAKGYFKAGKEFLKFDLVQGSYVITGSSEMSDERVVIIGHKLKKELIKTLFSE
ncbi:MAG: GTP-binding protein [Candidatus Fimenecus sp.]